MYASRKRRARGRAPSYQGSTITTKLERKGDYRAFTVHPNNPGYLCIAVVGMVDLGIRTGMADEQGQIW